MTQDGWRPGQYEGTRRREMSRWIREAVYPYSTVLRPALDAAGMRVERLRATPLEALGDGLEHVLQPTPDRIRRHGGLGMRARLGTGAVLGSPGRFVRDRIDPAYRPVSWTVAPAAHGDVFVASSLEDLDRLSELGRRALALSGVTADDRVVTQLGEGGGIGPLQLLRGCHTAGVQLLVLGDRAPTAARSSRPTVLAGTPRQLTAMLSAGLGADARILIIHADPLNPPSPSVVRAFRPSGIPVRVWWSPTGTRAAWVNCNGSLKDGLHTWPVHELVEIAGTDATGPIVWSPVGWYGSVWLRVRLGPWGRLLTERCPSCGATTPRIRVTPPPRKESPR